MFGLRVGSPGAAGAVEVERFEFVVGLDTLPAESASPVLPVATGSARSAGGGSRLAATHGG